VPAVAVVAWTDPAAPVESVVDVSPEAKLTGTLWSSPDGGDDAVLSPSPAAEVGAGDVDAAGADAVGAEVPPEDAGADETGTVETGADPPPADDRPGELAWPLLPAPVPGRVGVSPPREIVELDDDPLDDPAGELVDIVDVD